MLKKVSAVENLRPMDECTPQTLRSRVEEYRGERGRS